MDEQVLDEEEVLAAVLGVDLRKAKNSRRIQSALELQI